MNRPVFSFLAFLIGLVFFNAVALAKENVSVGTTAFLQARIAQNSYDYQARQELVQAYQQNGDYLSAYYQAAWLAWFAPSQFAYSDFSVRFIRDQRHRDRVASLTSSGPIALVLLSVDADRILDDSCINGTIAQQAGNDFSRLLAEVDRAEQELTNNDPVARAALTQLFLTLDDMLCLGSDRVSSRARAKVLRKADTQASAVVVKLPESPGAHRTFATVRARQAELENSSDRWAAAIAECERAHQLDPADNSICEMLWTLNLRAGNWAEAKRWQAECGKKTAQQDSASISELNN